MIAPRTALVLAVVLAAVPARAQEATLATLTCAEAGGAGRTLVEIAAAVPAPQGGATIDLATLTCGGLAPRWRQGARAIVPVIVAFLAGPEGRIARAAIDRVGEGLPRLCRDAANLDRRVLEVAASLP